MAELVGRRRRGAKHFALDRRHRRAVFTPEQHYQDDQGEWQDVDLTLRPLGGGVFEATRHLLNYRADATGLAVWHRPSGRGIKFLFPRVPDRVVRRTAEWDTAGGVTWRLTARKTGLKTSATVSAKRGPRTYRFDAEMLGGLAAPVPDAAGNLVQPAGHFVIQRVSALGADGIEYPAGPWRITGGAAEYDFDDTPLPAAAVPYVLDPTTTFAISASGDDGGVWGSGATYPPPAGELAHTTEIHLLTTKVAPVPPPEFIVEQSVVRWDTSGIPDDATITSASVRLRILSPVIQDGQGRKWTAEWYEPGTIGLEDYSTVVGNDAHSGLEIVSILLDTDQDVPLTNAAVNINKSGYTGLRFHISGDAPAAFTTNSVYCVAFDHETLSGPQLIVNYFEPGIRPDYGRHTNPKLRKRARDLR